MKETFLNNASGRRSSILNFIILSKELFNLSYKNAHDTIRKDNSFENLSTEINRSENEDTFFHSKLFFYD
ncbi:MAG: hypothetical protein AMS17_00105 [Spirochaetes bacterium DG_61]|nr:MAG: hypothetical protein AMS17_00105 [Spirochaetes bacterium DG_61]